jgi:hypothetical protein
MNAVDYIEREFEPFVAVSRYEVLSAGTKRIAERVHRIFERFVRARFPGQEITISHMAAFMFYRVVGERDSSDDNTGSVQLSTFLNGELGPLMHFLRHLGEVSFTLEELKRSEEFADRLVCLRTLTSEQSAFTHSRPAWPQDVKRLIGALNFDTASKRDHALIVVMAKTGYRPASLAKIRLDIHLKISDGENPSVTVILPGVKTTQGMDVQVILTGGEADVLIRWVKHRRQIFTSCPLLFISSVGGPITCDIVTRMITRLSCAAGYGAGFFTAQSFRVGFVSMQAAKAYSEECTHQTLLDRLTTGRSWSWRSRAVEAYINPNIRNYFSEGLGLNLEEFLTLDPEQLHELESLRPIQRRPITYFSHSRLLLMRICDNLQLEFDWNQDLCRERIGSKLVQESREFRSFIRDCQRLSTKSLLQLLRDTVGVLLEYETFDLGRVCMEPYRSELLEAIAAVSYRSERADTRLTSNHAQKLKVHRLHDREHAHRVLQFLAKRKSDRKTHLGRLPDDSLVLLKVRPCEEQCIEARSLPRIDLNLHFPVSDDDTEHIPSSSSNENNHTAPIWIESSSTDSDTNHADTSPYPHIHRTPSTATSSIRLFDHCRLTRP